MYRVSKYSVFLLSFCRCFPENPLPKYLNAAAVSLSYLSTRAREVSFTPASQSCGKLPPSSRKEAVMSASFERKVMAESPTNTLGYRIETYKAICSEANTLDRLYGNNQGEEHPKYGCGIETKQRSL